MVEIDYSEEYKLEVHNFAVEFSQRHTAKVLSDATGINATTISRGINRNGFTDITHKKLAEWIVEVAQSCKEKELPYEVEGLELPLSQALRAALEGDGIDGDAVVDGAADGMDGLNRLSCCRLSTQKCSETA